MQNIKLLGFLLLLSGCGAPVAPTISVSSPIIYNHIDPEPSVHIRVRPIGHQTRKSKASIDKRLENIDNEVRDIQNHLPKEK